jgi:aryl-alcohol dehydrogenase-like predicted oxidoreductase
MERRPLGKTGIDVSAIAFGAGPISGLMTGADEGRQRATVRRAIELGVNWFDTAATYGDGQSERSLGAALAEAVPAVQVHVATKVRLTPEQMADVRGAVRASVEGSLDRLRRPHVTLLQLHNSVTRRRGDLHTSLAPDEVLRPGGVLDALESVKREGLARHIGLTGLGHAEALAHVVASGRLETVQASFHLLNPSAGRDMPPEFAEDDLRNLFARCTEHGMGNMAIRVYAGGALAGQAPSPHTLKTKFFPLDLYLRDQERATRLARMLPAGLSLPEAALRFVLGQTGVSTAIVGLGDPGQVDAAVRFAAAGPLPDELVELLITEAHRR